MVVDEVQRLPALLNEVHRFIEERRLQFALLGSSARKLKTAGTNLLAGRATWKTLSPLTPTELGGDFDLERALRFGTIPLVWTADDPEERLRSYVRLYLSEEIRAEALVRNWASANVEVDFLLERASQYLALEVKSAPRISSAHLTGLRAIAALPPSLAASWCIREPPNAELKTASSSCRSQPSSNSSHRPRCGRECRSRKLSADNLGERAERPPKNPMPVVAFRQGSARRALRGSRLDCTVGASWPPPRT